MTQTLVLNQKGLQGAEISNKFFAVRNGSIFHDMNIQGGHFITNPRFWNFGSTFETIDDLIAALDKNSVRGAVKIFSGNLLYGTYAPGSLRLLEKPVKQLL